MKYCGVQRRGGRRGSKRLSDLDSMSKEQSARAIATATEDAGSNRHRVCEIHDQTLRTVDRRDTPARGMRDVARVKLVSVPS